MNDVFFSQVSCDQIICRELADGFYPDTSSGCVNFYRCVNGMQFKFTCAPGTKWSERLNTCDHAYNVNCQVARSSEFERDYEPRTGRYDPRHGGHDHHTSESWNTQDTSYDQSTTENIWRHEFSTTRPSTRRPFYLPPVTYSSLEPGEERSRNLPDEEEEEKVTTDTDSSASFWNQFSTTSPIIELATGQVSTEIITPEATPTSQATTTTTEAPTTRRNLFVLKRRTDSKISTTESSTLNVDEVTSARSNERKEEDDKNEGEMRSENWFVDGVPKVNETVDEKVTSANDTTQVTTELNGEKNNDQEKSINRRVRMQSGSNSLIGTMMKWASKNIVKSSSSEGISNETNVHGKRRRGGEEEAEEEKRGGKILMHSPFDLMEGAVELSTVKPLDPPITEANNELTAREGEDERSSMRPVYFPPSVRVPSTGTGSRYVSPNLPPLIKIVQARNDETIDHPSPWSFPTGHLHSSRVTSNVPNTRERRDKYLSGKENTPLTSHVTENHRHSHVGVISEGRCICSKP